MPHRRRPPIALLTLLLVAAGCSDDGSTGATGAQQATTTTTMVATAPFDPGAVEAMPSAGCGGATPVGPETIETIDVDGAERRYQRHVPPGHDGATPVPLILDFHGYSEGAGIHAQHSALGPFGDEKGFVTVTPQGQGDIPFWDIGAESVDLDFVEQLLDTEETELCIDRNRVFAAGLSNGAFMTSAVACAFEDRVAAAAPVAGIRDPEDCVFDRPVPVITFHGTEDRFVAYDGGLGPAVADLPAADGSGESLADAEEPAEADETELGGPVPELTAAWAGRNGCEGEPTETAVADDVVLIEFPCAADATTELYRVDGGGHSWPGSDFSARIEPVVGRTTFSIDANELMWAFFEAHPLT